MRKLLFVAAVTALVVPAFALPLQNGDFSSNTVAVGGSDTAPSAITGWSFYDEHSSAHSIADGAVSGTYSTWGGGATMTAYSGNSAIIKAKGGDASGSYFGIWQTVDTVVGVNYTLSSMINSVSNLGSVGQEQWFGYSLCYDLSGAAFTRGGAGVVEYASGASNNTSNTGFTGSTWQSGAWVQKTASFTATSTHTTIAWLQKVNCSPTPSAGQLFGIDSVTLIPEPTALALLALGLPMLRRRHA